MRMMKLGLAVGVALLVALGVGWLWGASGRWDVDRVVQAAELRSDLFEARSSVFAARVDLYNVNFGDAKGHLEEATGLLRHAMKRLSDAGRNEDAKRLEPALARIDEAQRLAGRLDPGANSRAADAAKTIDDVLGTVSPR
jgi:hypothetical protein